MKANIFNLHRITWFSLLLGFSLASQGYASEALKPFILANLQQGSIEQVKKETIAKLEASGFTIAGSYSPYPDATIIIVTSDRLLNHAAKSRNGGFGAAQRISLTEVDGSIQIAYTHPGYMANMYRMQDDLTDVLRQLEQALGKQSTYGSDDGLTKEELRDYHYKILMPYFTDTLELASYPNQSLALKKINSILDSNKVGVSRVYQIDIPGKNESIIGVHLSGAKGNECSGDQYIMSRIDFKKIKSTGHLPYEILVRDGAVIALQAEFRIAINFPDLSMIGSNSFASIMCAPDNIKSALLAAVGGEQEF